MAMELGDGTPQSDFACSNMTHLVEVSKKYELDPALLLSLIHHESRWKPKAKSKYGACGLTQVVPKWTGRPTGGKKYTCEELFDPQTSISVGAQVLSFWIRNYGKGNLRVGLCGYNAGYRCKGADPMRSGLSYADRVRRTARKINRLSKRLEKKAKK